MTHQDGRDVLDAQPAQLDLLPGGDIQAPASERLRDARQRA